MPASKSDKSEALMAELKFMWEMYQQAVASNGKVDYGIVGERCGMTRQQVAKKIFKLKKDMGVEGGRVKQSDGDSEKK